MPHLSYPSDVDILMAPTDVRAQEAAAAKRRALARRVPGGITLALTPGSEALGRGILSEAGAGDERLAGLMEARAGMAERAAAGQRAETGLGYERERLGLQRAALAQGRWVPLQSIDPDTGERVTVGILDTRTSQVRPLGQAPQAPPLPQLGAAHGPPGGAPAPAAAAPMRRYKLTEMQQKTAGAVGGSIDAFRNALTVGFPKSGPGGIAQGFGQEAMQRGFPGFASEDAQRTYAAWYNVIRPLVNIRTGQQMSNQELTREFNALAPRPGMSDRTMFENVQLIPQMLRRYTVGLPPTLRAQLNAEYDQIEAMLPRSVEDIGRMRVGRERAGADAQGRPIYRR